MLNLYRPLSCTSFFSLIVFAWSVVPCSALDSETQKVLTRLEKTWNVQKKEIATAHIVFRWAHGQKISEPFCKPLTSEQVYEIVNAVDYSDPQKAFDELVKNLYVSNSYISSMELFYAPPKSRIQAKVGKQNRDKIRPGFGDYITVFDGKNSIRVNPFNNQVDITGGYMYPISQLRFDPSFPTPAIRNKFTFQAMDEILTCTLQNENKIIIQTVDIATGLALYNHSQFLANNKIGGDTFQRCFFTSPGGIVFPRLKLNISYENGVVVIADIYMIEEVTFNSPLSDDLFAVSLPKDTHVWDSRSNEKKPDFIKLSEKTNNVMLEVGEPLDYTHKNSSSRRWLILICVNLFVLSLIAWNLYKKHKG